MTLAEVKRRGRSKATVEYYTSKLGQLVRCLGADTIAASFDGEMVDRYIDKRREEGASQHNISKELGAFRHLLRIAKRRQKWSGDIDALFPIGFSSGYEPRRRALTWEEIPKLLGAFDGSPRLKAWVALAIATGGRESEVAKIQRDDISHGLDVVQLRGEKTDLADDAVAIPNAFRWLLVLAMGIIDGMGHIGASKYYPNCIMVGPWANSCRDLEAACKRAGIPKVSANDLRRTHATLLRSAGVPIDLVARQLRHVDTRMVQRVYGRLTAEQTGKLLPGKDSTKEAVNADEKRSVTAGRDQHSTPNGAVNIQLTGQEPEFWPMWFPNDIAGVSDGDRTRDHWSHMPEASPGELAFLDKLARSACAEPAPRDSAPSTIRPEKEHPCIWCGRGSPEGGPCPHCAAYSASRERILDGSRSPDSDGPIERRGHVNARVDAKNPTLGHESIEAGAIPAGYPFVFIGCPELGAALAGVVAR